MHSHDPNEQTYKPEKHDSEVENIKYVHRISECVMLHYVHYQVDALVRLIHCLGCELPGEEKF